MATMNGTDHAENGNNCNASMGPNQLIEALGLKTVVFCYVGCFTIVFGLLGYAVYHFSKRRNFGAMPAYLLFTPALVLVATVLPLISPPLGRMVNIVQDLLIFSSMLVYMDLTLQMVGGSEALLDIKSGQDEPTCAIGSPPFCCLGVLRPPQLTLKLFNLFNLPTKLKVGVDSLSLLVFSGLAVNNIHQPVSFEVSPMFLLTLRILIILGPISLYTFHCFADIAAPRLMGSNPRLRAKLISVVFMSFKVTDILLIILEAAGVLPELPQLECVPSKQLILPLVQIVLLLPSCILLPPSYSKQWPLSFSQNSVDNKLADKPRENLQDPR